MVYLGRRTNNQVLNDEPSAVCEGIDVNAMTDRAVHVSFKNRLFLLPRVMDKVCLYGEIDKRVI